MKKLFVVLSVLLIASMFVACAAPAAPAAAPAAPADAAAPAAEAPAAAPAAEMVFTTVVKIAGINWFDRMETGVVAWGQDTGVNPQSKTQNPKSKIPPPSSCWPATNWATNPSAWLGPWPIWPMPEWMPWPKISHWKR